MIDSDSNLNFVYQQHMLHIKSTKYCDAINLENYNFKLSNGHKMDDEWVKERWTCQTYLWISFLYIQTKYDTNGNFIRPSNP